MTFNMIPKHFRTYFFIYAIALGLVGVGLFMHFAPQPDVEKTSYQKKVTVPQSHHTYPGALKSGEQAVMFTLKKHDGEHFSLKQKLQQGPVVLTFFRGNWCPLCAAHLKELEAIKPQVEELDGQLVAISAQTLAKTKQTQGKFSISYPVVSDKQMKITKAYGVDWPIPEEDRDDFKAWLDKSTGQSLNEFQNTSGQNISGQNTSGQDKSGQNTSAWTLPVPATYVIAPSGEIIYAHVDEDYKKRAQPEKILNALRALTTSNNL